MATSSNNQQAVKGKEVLYICTHCNRREKQVAISGRHSFYCYHENCHGSFVASNLYETLDYVTNKHYPFDKDRDSYSEDTEWDD